MRKGAPSVELRNLSSRKLWEMVNSGNLPQREQELAEQELLLRRHHLEKRGSLHPASDIPLPAHPSNL